METYQFLILLGTLWYLIFTEIPHDDSKGASNHEVVTFLFSFLLLLIGTGMWIAKLF